MQQTQIWLSSLLVSPEQHRALKTLLDEKELARADAFMFPEHQRRFAVARAHLRQILASRLNMSAQDIHFNYNQYGKPSLQWSESSLPLHFNLSHSGELAIYAINPRVEVGIDIELQKPDMEFDGLAQRFFSIREAEIIHSLTDFEKQAAFYRCWTRKEALLKALGQGLSYPLNQCEVTCNAHEKPKILQLIGYEQTSSAWTLAAIDVPQDYMAAVVVQEANAEFKLAWWGKTT
jgi:4'-phosphopantetheinyl transferase